MDSPRMLAVTSNYEDDSPMDEVRQLVAVRSIAVLRAPDV